MQTLPNIQTEITHPDLHLDALDNLWFQVSGTLCNIACDHCFISCSPLNHTFEFMTLEQVKGYLKESIEMGVKEYYFTGGEPFMNKEILDILDLTLQYGPATVLTNGMLFKEKTVQRLQEMEAYSIYSLEIRVSIDGYTEEMNDVIRGKGVFKKAMGGVKLLYDHGFLPIITVTKTWEDHQDEEVLNGFMKTLKSYGYDRPRIKILPSLKIGKEIARSRGYDQYEMVTEEMLAGYDCSQLICSNSRVATNRGVYVCPILIESEDAYMGETLEKATESFNLKHQACYTCYLYGAICSNFSSGGKDV
ncbi:MAG: radical SAM protein [Aliifodinibius sp.]|nr:radical SAM protein [candidate division Zixibacteria bacterium]NIT60364.1 radical SAM protein [Fodinibius sp.]NIS48141.1 radical SAM protein [candidate division Zixibacteria bacterium]NIV08389.1 radical SAM protein [candidate division Zixibacteria bacterium]NIX58608.1 radical SAM protein [candidate division Zixibacteria bacterium]